MHKTPTVAGRVRPVWRFVLLSGSLLLVVAVSVFLWPRLRLTRRMDAARRALSEGDTVRAVELLADADTIAADPAEVHYLMAVANRRAGEIDSFELHLERASELGWPNESIERQRWLATAQAGNVKAVESQLMGTINRGVSDEAAEEIYEAMAKGHLAAYRLREAWTCLDFWLHWRPDAPSARMLRGSLYERIDKRTLAAEDYCVVLKALPNCRGAHLKLARLLFLERGRVEEAREHFHKCLTFRPNDGDAILGMAQCERRLGNAVEANRYLQGALALKLTPHQLATALAERGELLLSEGKATEAVRALVEASELVPSENEIHSTLARALTATGERKRAKHHAELAERIRLQQDRLTAVTNRVVDSPDDAELRFEAGSILVEVGLRHEGVGWLMSALKCDPNHRKAHQLLSEYCEETGNQKLAAQMHLLRGTALLREGRFVEALEEFGHAKDHPDTAASAYALSGEALYKAGHFGSAVHILSRALQLDPSQTDARRWLAAAYHDIGAMDHAMQHLHVVAEQAPTDARPHRLMGLIHKDFEAYDKAIAAYRESLRRDSNQPDKDEILIELAECQVKLRHHAEALTTLHECPPSAQKFALEAECHYAQGDASAAKRSAARALELKPDHLGALQLAASLELDAGDAESSVRILRQAVEYHPKEFRVRYRLAQAYQRLGESELAEEQMRQMQELRDLRRRFTDLHAEAIKNPADVEIRYQLGVLADQLGKPELARTWYAAVIGMDPEHEDARKALSPER